MNSDQQPEQPGIGGTKFFKNHNRKPVSGADIRPAEIIPENADMNAITDSIVGSVAVNEAERKKNLAELARSEYELSVKCARAEMADKAVKAAEAARKKEFHDEVAQRARDAEARKKALRQIDLKLKLSKFVASCGEVLAALEEIEDKNCAQVRLLRESVNALVETFPKS